MKNDPINIVSFLLQNLGLFIFASSHFIYVKVPQGLHTSDVFADLDEAKSVSNAWQNNKILGSF